MIVANSDHQHATPFDDRSETERLPEELRQMARRYAALPVPRPTTEETSQLIARLQASANHDQLELAARPSRRRRRVRPLLEVLVAVLMVGVLVSGFLFAFASRWSHLPAQQSAQGGAQNIIVSVSANTKIFSGKPSIVANRASDGKHIWSYVIDQQFVVPTVITVQAHVVYAKGGKQVYALRASDGKLLWHISLPWPTSSPEFGHDAGGLVLDHGTIFTQLLDDVSETSILFALRANDGKVLWQYQAGGEELFTVAGGKVYVAAYLDNKYQLVALQETTGHFLWSHKRPISFIAQQGNNVYVVSIVWSIPQGRTPFDTKSDSTLLALDAQNGTVLWSSKIVTTFLARTNVGHMMIEKDQIIFFNGSHFCAYRISDGHELWCSQHDPSNAGSIIPFALVNNTIYATYPPFFLGGVTQLEALDSNTGKVLWSKKVPDPLSLMHGLIAIMDDSIYLLASRPSEAESIYALSLNDGHQLWQYDFPFMTLASAAGR
jgi:outer membrane protein assembly factor BamB